MLQTVIDLMDSARCSIDGQGVTMARAEYLGEPFKAYGENRAEAIERLYHILAQKFAPEYVDQKSKLDIY